MLSLALKPLGRALILLMGSLFLSTLPVSAATLKLCAVPQLYLALEHLQGVLTPEFEAHYDTPSALLTKLQAAPDTTQVCDLLLSSDERLPITLIRAHKGLGSALYPFTRAPLVLWSADPALFAGIPLGSKPTKESAAPTSCPAADEVAAAPVVRPPDPWDEPAAAPLRPESMTQAQWDRYVNSILLRAAQADSTSELDQALRSVKLTAVAYPSPHLTPVGYVAQQVLAQAQLPRKRYEYEHEYMVYEQVRAGEVQCGLVTKPLVVATANSNHGSYLTIPRRVHADVQYYVLLLEQSKDKPEARAILTHLRHDPKVQAVLNQFGFAPLAPEEP